MSGSNNRAIMGRRTAGKLGAGGGGGKRNVLFPPICLGGLGQTQVLQISTSQARHQRVPVQSGPGAALIVIEAEFFLELLMRLLADPARLDRSHQRSS